jgi:DNA-binding transcriptional regulator of glucitol operon
MTVWILLVAVVLGWLLQLWLTSRQSLAHVHATGQLRRLGTVAVGKGGRRYRGGVAFVSLATDGKRVTGAVSLRGFTTFARPVPVPALVGIRLGVVAGDRPIEGLTDGERIAAREAAKFLRSARGAVPIPAATSGGEPSEPLTTGAARPA